MQRDLMKRLEEWRRKENRLPLILQGARQVGKTWLLKEFGSRYFEDTCYINFENRPELHLLFEANISPERIIQYLSAAHGKAIRPQETLIIFDEIQEVPRALTSLKYFAELAPEYVLCCAGSFLGVALHANTSFPVGKVNFLQLHPFSFHEFILAQGEISLLDFINENPLEQHSVFKEKLLDYLKLYMVVGGMPAAIITWLKTKDFEEVNSVLQAILQAYEQDFSKHAPRSVVPKIRHLWNSIPSQLSKEQRKFVYGVVREGARAREYEEALLWLQDCGLLYCVHRVTVPRVPMKSYVDLKAFKVFTHDIGLLRVMSGLPSSMLLDGDSLFVEFKGALSEQFVLQQLRSEGFDPCYWSSDGQAEVDFLIQYNNSIIPIEVKAGENVKAKSLQVYRNQYSPSTTLRFSLLDLRINDPVVNIPLYTIFTLNALLKQNSFG
jgi:uncharacterized protein